MELVRRVRALFDGEEEWRAAGLFVAMLVGAGFEALGIGLVMPFIALVAEPAQVASMPLVGQAFEGLGLVRGDQIIVAAGLGLLMVFLIKNLYLGGMYFLKFRFVFRNQVKLSRRLFRAYLKSPYAYHLDKNSARQLRNVNDEVRMTFGHVVIPLLVLGVELSVVAVIGLMLFVMEPVVAPLAMVSFGVLSYGFYRVVRKKSREYGEAQQHHAGLMIQWVNQGLGGIKEARLLGCEDYFLRAYHESSQGYAKAMRFHRFIKEMPRNVIETIGLGAMVLIVILLVGRGQEMAAILPVLGLFAVAAVRLMPSLTRIIAAVTSIRHFLPSLSIIVADLEELEALEKAEQGEAVGLAGLESEAGKAISGFGFEEAIEFRGVRFRYPGQVAWAIDDVSLTIRRGESVALVGPSGAGKTTLVDLMLGLLTPTDGEIAVDGRSIQSDRRGWQDRLGYIAQPTYLLDDSVRRNVAFGVAEEEIDEERVREALKMASLGPFVEGLPEGVETEVGESGVRFSGGQRQRVGIARALYRRPEVLVLDEATSALDNQTEKEISAAIQAMAGDRTLIIIAHRLTTVRECDRIFFIKEGRLVDEGTFEELLFRNEEFRQMARLKEGDGGDLGARSERRSILGP